MRKNRPHDADRPEPATEEPIAGLEYAGVDGREVVNAALFLANDEASFVNDTIFTVDGGLAAAYVTPE
ncbi:MAG TPA: hypothetical protein VK926_02215 [Gaiellaceae bacterium]|nr:hypothetical protein [Gaiellaceae bacterium]